MEKIIRAIVFCFLIFGAVIPALAAEDPEKYPSKPVTLFHAYAPGGSTDLAARAVAAVAPKYFSQPIIVVPKPGGAGLVALDALASAKPDGYTYHLGRNGELTNGPFIEKIPYDVEKDFIPVGQVALDYNVFTVSVKAPWKTVEDLIAAAKKEPEKLKFAASGTTTNARLIFEAFCHVVGIKLTCVPFKGSAPAAIAVAGGHIPVLTSAISEALPHVQRGDLRPILVTAYQRVPEYPNAPIPKEKGWDFPFGTWHTVFAPKGTPPAIVARFEAVLKKIVEDKEYNATMVGMGSTPGFVSGKDFAVYWKEERTLMGALIKEIGLGLKQ